MNNKGFTLIELIATIALLAIIAMISFVSISGMLEEAKKNDCISLTNNIVTAAKEYYSDNRFSLSSKTYYITAKALIDGKYLTGPIVNPFTKAEITASSVKITVTLKDDYIVNSVVITAPTVLKTCSG